MRATTLLKCWSSRFETVGKTCSRSERKIKMEMENGQTHQTSQQKTQRPSGQVEELIRQWLFRFGIEHKEDIAPKLPLWIEAFGHMDPIVLARLFERAMRTCKFFPKISEILQPMSGAQENSEAEKAERAWNYIF